MAENRNKTQFEDIPPTDISHLLNYLSIADLKCLRLVSKQISQLVTNLYTSAFVMKIDFKSPDQSILERFVREYEFFVNSCLDISVILPTLSQLSDASLKRRVVRLIDDCHHRIVALQAHKTSKDLITEHVTKLHQLEKLCIHDYHSNVDPHVLITLITNNADSLVHLDLEGVALGDLQVNKPSLQLQYVSLYDCSGQNAIHSLITKSSSTLTELILWNIDLDIEFVNTFKDLKVLSLSWCEGEVGITSLLAQCAHSLRKLSLTDINLDTRVDKPLSNLRQVTLDRQIMDVSRCQLVTQAGGTLWQLQE